jgi:cell division protein FtsL
MTSVAHGARVGRRTRRTAARRRPLVLAGGVLWIVLFAVLLAGVVAINVAVLRLNLQLDELGTERTELQADVSLLRSELSSAAATARIERLARGELGMVEADQDATIYVELER